MILSFPHYLQHDAMDCGATCLRMIAKYYGKDYPAEMLRHHCFITRNGVSMLGIRHHKTISWFGKGTLIISNIEGFCND